MNLTVDHESPVPPSHQLAQGLRYRIAVGELEPGEPLPSLREAAGALGVHYLTVRKAYQELKQDGLVESARGKGTWVSRTIEHRYGDRALHHFLARIFREGWREHAIRPPELVELLDHFADGGGLDDTRSAVEASRENDDAVHFVECNRLQARDYASQLEERLDRPVRPWLLDGDEPPAGTVVGTYFHFNDIRERWPHRAADLRFVTVSLDPELSARVERETPSGEDLTKVRLCEVDDVRIQSVHPDLVQLLPESRFRIQTVRVERPEEALATDDPSPVLFAPRLWAQLTDEQQCDPRARLLRYVVDPSNMEGLS